jgi:outer membrane protein assembly factor BamE (lipoprotein component of BamABCDE complex)
MFCVKCHFKYLLLFAFLVNCQLQEPVKNHGIVFLENRSNKLVVYKTNKNDVLDIIGEPHIKSINNDDIWLYLERSLSKGKYHKLGKHTLKSNNTLVLTFDKFGILQTKKLYSKEDIEQIAFLEKNTKNNLSKKSFVSTFLSSVREKMYGRRRKND